VINGENPLLWQARALSSSPLSRAEVRLVFVFVHKGGDMSNGLRELTEDMQQRIREVAYLMWESAGRQHGMAMQYWLKAECEVLATWQAATERMMAGVGGRTTSGADVSPVQIAVEPAPKPSVTPDNEATKLEPIRPAAVVALEPALEAPAVVESTTLAGSASTKAASAAGPSTSDTRRTKGLVAAKSDFRKAAARGKNKG
jgi:hypothetical protein